MSRFKHFLICFLILGLSFNLLFFNFANAQDLPEPQRPSATWCKDAKEASPGFDVSFTAGEFKATNTGYNTVLVRGVFTYNSQGFNLLSRYSSEGKIWIGKTYIYKDDKDFKGYDFSNSKPEINFTATLEATEQKVVVFKAAQQFCWIDESGNSKKYVIRSDSVRVTVGPKQQPTTETVPNDGQGNPGVVGSSNDGTSAGQYGYAACVADPKADCGDCCAEKKGSFGVPTIAFVQCWIVCLIDRLLTGLLAWVVNFNIKVMELAVGLI